MVLELPGDSTCPYSEMARCDKKLLLHGLGKTLGIDVRETKDGRREVFYNAEHQNLLDTSTENKPHRQKAGDLVVASIFRRRKARSGDGDGNPFIYALKGLHRHSISNGQLWKFRPNFLSTLGAYMSESPYDKIAPLPSSKPIARYVAKKAGSYQPRGRSRAPAFLKRSAAEVLAELEEKYSSDEIPRKLKGPAAALISRLRKSQNANFAMKHVDQRLRDYIEPLVLAPNAPVSGHRILLVDDLLSSGATLRTAHRLLTEAGAAHVAALCLLSKV
ncbi:phosphoribosyltransferase family protein [Halopseudomonas pachastrellae]|nr:phosphoribosyltransferase family protein [Halopseudomonas pachastrellae]